MTTATTLSWVWQPAISPLHILGLSGILASLAIFAYARTFRARPLGSLALLVMRLAVVVALAVVLMGPSAMPPRVQRTGKPTLIVLADTSGSMLTPECGGLSRIEFAQRQWLSREQLQELSRDYELRLMGFDEKVRRLSAQSLLAPAEKLATGRSTRLVDSVRSVLAGVPEGASETSLLVLSDGHDSDDAPVHPIALLARARGVGVHTVCLGGATFGRDIIVVALPEQQYLLADETGHIVVKVHQGGLDGTRTTLHLRSRNNHITRPIAFGDKSTVTLRLPIKEAQAGLYEYRIWVDSVEGENELGNNSQSVFLKVTARRIKVALLEGEPFWDTKFIAQSLRKDSRIELIQIMQLSHRKQSTIVTRAKGEALRVPTTAEELGSYSVIILGRGVEKLLTEKTARLLPGFVSDQGGHIVFARGRAYDDQTLAGRQIGRDIAVLEPVVWGRGVKNNLSLSLTPAGRG
ncbi:hypothetical protein LCGC14_2292290, partial [marine sediment metagenome]